MKILVSKVFIMLKSPSNSSIVIFLKRLFSDRFHVTADYLIQCRNKDLGYLVITIATGIKHVPDSMYFCEAETILISYL